MIFPEESYAYESKDEKLKPSLTRSERANTRRSLDEIDRSIKDQKKLLIDSSTLNEENIEETARRLRELSRLQAQWHETQSILESSFPAEPSSARLNEKERREIRGYYMTGNYTQEQLARYYEVGQNTVSNIVKDYK